MLGWLGLVAGRSRRLTNRVRLSAVRALHPGGRAQPGFQSEDASCEQDGWKAEQRLGNGPRTEAVRLHSSSRMQCPPVEDAHYPERDADQPE